MKSFAAAIGLTLAIFATIAAAEDAKSPAHGASKK
jgi:hypothetical protein